LIDAGQKAAKRAISRSRAALFLAAHNINFFEVFTFQRGRAELGNVLRVNLQFSAKGLLNLLS